MSDGREKLITDLKIIEHMAAEIAEYLRNPHIFWPKIEGSRVQTTIGGFWMRRHRLLALQKTLLDAAERRRLRRANQQFDTACSEQRGRYEQKAGQELEARLRQWGEALRELLEDEPPSMAYYRQDVQTRAIIQAIFNQPVPIPTEKRGAILEQIEALDSDLRERWETGRFVWPTEWEPAYPRSTYWWLYGKLVTPG